MAKNKFGRTVKVDSIMQSKNEATEFEHRVLKTYQTKDKQVKTLMLGGMLRVVHIPMVHWEYGDIYVKDVVSYHKLIAGTDEWKKDYDFLEKYKEFA